MLPFLQLFTNTSYFRIIFAVVYWYVWTILLPRRGGYTLEEEDEVLEDGTSVSKLVKSYKL